MKFEWHEAKSRMNRRKHGVSFEAARQVFDDPFALMQLDTTEGGEERWRAIGRAGIDRVLVVAHAVRLRGSEEVIRIISARRALKHERQHYEDQAQ
ncbi:MAG: BrnT family toxin [Gammaproteobacteria bacterium]